jgi:hypothetical protein
MGLDGELWLGGLSLSVDPLQTAAHQVELSLLLFSYQSRNVSPHRIAARIRIFGSDPEAFQVA